MLSMSWAKTRLLAQSVRSSERSRGVILTWKLESGGLAVMADCPAAMEHEWVSVPTCVPCFFLFFFKECLPVRVLAAKGGPLGFSDPARHLPHSQAGASMPPGLYPLRQSPRDRGSVSVNVSPILIYWLLLSEE